MNTGGAWPIVPEAWARVLRMQTKLHRWAIADPDRRFDDVFNLVYDPAFLVGRGSGCGPTRAPAPPGSTGRATVDPSAGAETLLDHLAAVKTGIFCPVRVRRTDDPQAGRRSSAGWGSRPCADRVVQAALKLVLEPIFEADFQPCSYGFRPETARPGRGRGDPPCSATRSYEWVVEADIEACLDVASHCSSV